MSHQIRPGARGGRDQFSWDQVKEDKQRSNYLGSCIHGLPDKFKKGAETFWYTKETKSIPVTSAKEEIKNIKSKEKQLMDALLGDSSSANKKKPEIVKTEENKRSLSDYDQSRKELGRYRDNSRNKTRDEQDDSRISSRYSKEREYIRRDEKNSRIRRTYSKSPRRNRSRSPKRSN